MLTLHPCGPIHSAQCLGFHCYPPHQGTVLPSVRYSRLPVPAQRLARPASPAPSVTSPAVLNVYATIASSITITGVAFQSLLDCLLLLLSYMALGVISLPECQLLPKSVLFQQKRLFPKHLNSRRDRNHYRHPERLHQQSSHWCICSYHHRGKLKLS